MLGKYPGKAGVKHLMPELILFSQSLAADEDKITHQLDQSSDMLVVLMFLLTLFSSNKYQMNIKQMSILNSILCLLLLLPCSLFAMLLVQKQDLFTLRTCCLYPVCSHNSSIVVLQPFPCQSIVRITMILNGREQ